MEITCWYGFVTPALVSCKDSPRNDRLPVLVLDPVKSTPRTKSLDSSPTPRRAFWTSSIEF
eukprot:639480-Rhodomonas_salina.1